MANKVWSIPFRFPGITHVRCMFTTRVGGHSTGRFWGANLSFGVGDEMDAVNRNRQEVLKEIGCPFFAEVEQVHGDRMIFVEEGSHVPSLEKADALATGLWNVPLLIKVADCQPVLVSDVQARAIAAFHVGWRANRGGFLQKWIREFCEHYNLTPEELMVVRGPSLGPAHCEFINFATEWGEGFDAYYDPSSQNVNLWQLTRDQLIEAKIPQEHIFSLDLCTYSCDFHFFSYRRDHLTGRQGGIIWKRDEDKG